MNQPRFGACESRNLANEKVDVPAMRLAPKAFEAELRDRGLQTLLAARSTTLYSLR
jgi:hypothetical protein